MDFDNQIAEVDKCMECEICFEVCQTCVVTKKPFYTPVARLKTAKKIFQAEEVDPEEVEGLYSCLKCERCTSVCPEEINVSEIVRQAQGELTRKEMRFPLVEKAKEQMDLIRKTGNPQLGEPEKRWEWLPEEFPRHESDTLFFVGCLPSFWLKDIALSSYLLLKKAGVDFTMMREEVCCGHYLYNMGGDDLALEQFEELKGNFSKYGIKRIITVCPGCYRTFKDWFPQMIGKVDLEVLHLSQVLLPFFRMIDAASKRKLSDDFQVTYQDPCELGRIEGIYEEPRDLLRLCGVRLSEMEENREEAPCCGGGGGVPGNFLDLAVDIGEQLLDGISTDNVVTSCPACFLRLNHTSKKRDKGKKTLHISRVLLDFLDEKRQTK
ncbi:MAG: (Fe-S)-binding protein [Syntrophobacterales bacterium]|nr:(Fe-S)-binding protein [Syntrophobacterales bacterium]